MAKKQVDDDGKKDSFVMYKEWEMLISPLSDADRLLFFDLLMGWDFITIPTVESRHLQSIIGFVFGKISENREKYLDKCKTNSEAAKARWDEYKRLKALAMQTDANAYERIQTHENAMLNENENDHVNENEHDHVHDMRGAGAGEVKIEDVEGFAKKTAAFIQAFGTAGNRFKTERAYANAVKRLKADGRTEAAAHEFLIDQASKDQRFCIQVKRKRRDPDKWLDDGDWSKDYAQELKNHKEVENTTAKGGLNNGNTSRKEQSQQYADAARRHTREIEAEFGQGDHGTT